MREWKIFTASLVFLILTAVKLLFPGPTAALREDVSAVLSTDVDYRDAIEALGRRITEPIMSADGRAGAGDAVTAELVFIPSEQTEKEMPETGTDAETNDEIPEGKDTEATDAEEPGAGEEKKDPGETPSPDEAADPEMTENESETTETAEPESDPPEAAVEESPSTEEEIPAVVAAFLASQAGFTAQAIPANVRSDMPSLPFSYSHPVAAAQSSGFGYRLHPLAGEVRFHYGTDLAAMSGEAIAAFADGTVYFAGENDGYGKYIILEHGGGYTTLYAHCSALYVGAGQSVKAGETIALVGATGQVTGPHLHFELRCGESYLNPEYYLASL
ncbi:MAG: M23 family metallopeptidase [Eubacteriales bacterium]|nr:M23 family metallopeptidase [Eubacteriales bacterium]